MAAKALTATKCKTVHCANFSPPTTIASDTSSTVTAESGAGTRRPPIRYKKPPRLGITLGQGQRSTDMFGSPTTLICLGRQQQCWIFNKTRSPEIAIETSTSKLPVMKTSVDEQHEHGILAE